MKNLIRMIGLWATYFPVIFQTDYFNLIKTTDGWVIADEVSTRKQNG